MTDYFIKLFDYDKLTNLKLIELLKEEKGCAKGVGIMSHLLVAQQIWLKRCLGESGGVGSLWPNWKVDRLESILVENNANWIGFLSALNDVHLDEIIISYQNTKGATFTNRLEDVLTHVINHGTHHRAQIGQHLKLDGFTLPNTDYIFYIREQNR